MTLVTTTKTANNRVRTVFFIRLPSIKIYRAGKNPGLKGVYLTVPPKSIAYYYTATVNYPINVFNVKKKHMFLVLITC